ncbi:MAG: hypothetical protein Q4B94_05085 [Pseudomonadota bacterium]|nr:hypothetical protein [Pseudomonadota bacterium]
MPQKNKFMILFLLIPISLYAAEKIDVGDIMQRASRQPSPSSSVTRDMNAHNRLVQDLHNKDQEIIRFVNNGIAAANRASQAAAAAYEQERPFREAHAEQMKALKATCLAQCQAVSDSDGGWFNNSSRQKCVRQCNSI